MDLVRRQALAVHNHRHSTCCSKRLQDDPVIPVLANPRKKCQGNGCNVTDDLFASVYVVCVYSLASNL